jgi:hypothetical protein
VAVVPSLCIGLLKALKCDARVQWHRDKELAIEALLLRLTIEREPARTISAEYRVLSEAMQKLWTTATLRRSDRNGPEMRTEDPKAFRRSLALHGSEPTAYDGRPTGSPSAHPYPRVVRCEIAGAC